MFARRIPVAFAFVPALLAICASALARPVQAQITNCVGGCNGVPQVTPDGATTWQPKGSNGLTYGFIIKNVGTGIGTWTLSCAATGGVTCVSVSLPSVTLDPNDAEDVTVTYNLGSTNGVVKLKATGNQSDSGYVNVNGLDYAPPTAITLRNHNATNRDRSLCLTAGAGEGAAWQCGDLLVTHSLPGYSTMGRDRSLTLLYTSAQAVPQPVVVAAVTEASNLVAPTTVQVKLDVNTGSAYVTKATATYLPWGGAGVTKTRQLAIGYDASADTSGIYPFRLIITNQYLASTQADTLEDSLMVVNRANSRFGRGWSLAGLEEIRFNQPVGTALGDILWIGGDGSAKRYRKLNATTWQAPAGAFPDSIIYNGTSLTYTRTLRHGIKVVFDALGRHIRTENRARDSTSFKYNGSTMRLDTIAVPPQGRPRTKYILKYNTSSTKIDSIGDPTGRWLDLVVTSGNLLKARDPVVNDSTKFTYDASGRMLTRRSPRGFTTRFEYAKGFRLTQVNEPFGTASPPDTARTQFVPWDELGFAFGAGNQTAVDTASVLTTIRGPRYPTIPDTARFWVDVWGAPTRIKNALGDSTLMVRGDPAVPALVTLLRQPNGRVIKQTWDERGNLRTQVDSTIHVDGRANRTTTWTYAWPNTPDGPSQVTDPMSRNTYFWYDSLGITDSIKDQRNHRTVFVKFASSSGNSFKGLLNTATERSVNPWRESDSTDITADQVTTFTYDTVGNIRTVKNPQGVITTYARDSLERVTDVYEPLGRRHGRAYDANNRVVQTQEFTAAWPHPYSVQPLASCDSNQLVCTDNSDPMTPDTLITSYRQTAAGADSVADPRGVTRKFAFDAAGRLWKETDELGRARTGYFNAAGLLDSTRTRDSLTITFRYDTLGQQTTLIFPARVNAGWPGQPPTTIRGDTILTTYDNMGRVISKRNHEALILRSYFADGALRKQVDTTFGLPRDSVEYTYDGAGMVTKMLHNQRDTLDYKYKSNGDLDSLIVRFGGTGGNRLRAFGFQWDSLGRRRLVKYPKWTTVTFSYDGAGMLRQLLSFNTHDDPNIRDRLDVTERNRLVDPAGRIWRQTLKCSSNNAADVIGNPCNGSAFQSDSNTYNRLSMMVRQKRNTTALADTMHYDRSGNLMVRYTGTLSNQTRLLFSLVSGSNRLASDTNQVPNGVRTLYSYTKEGSLYLQQPPDTSVANAPLWRVYYYDGLERLTGSQWVEPNGSGGYDHHYNQDRCEYNPDGQQARACDNAAPWLLFEGPNVYKTHVATANSGWFFVHGPGVDDPLLGRMRVNDVMQRELYYITDGQGRQLAVADSTGYLTADDFNGDKADHKYAGRATPAHSIQSVLRPPKSRESRFSGIEPRTSGSGGGPRRIRSDWPAARISTSLMATTQSRLRILSD